MCAIISRSEDVRQFKYTHVVNSFFAILYTALAFLFAVACKQIAYLKVSFILRHWEDGGSPFFLNISKVLPDNMVSHSRKWYFPLRNVIEICSAVYEIKCTDELTDR
jgi:hypothetical protein